MEDILSLPIKLASIYSKTQLKSVEDCFIKIASDFRSEFSKWIRGIEPQKLQLGTNTLESLQYLVSLKTKFPSGMTQTDFIQELFKSESAKRLFPTIFVFAKIHNYPVLDLFSDILTAASGHISMQGGEENIGSIENDLKVISDSFRSHMEKIVSHMKADELPHKQKGRNTRKNKLIGLFSDILKEFSTEMSSAYESVGQKDVASFMSSGSLADPKKTAEAIRLSFDPSYTFVKSEKVAKEALKKDLENHDAIFNFIRNESLKYAGIISNKEYALNQQENVTSVDFSHFLSEDILKDIEPKTERINLRSNQLANPFVTMMISSVLFRIFQEIHK